MAEVTRVITIQMTKVINDYFITGREEEEERIRKKFPSDTDQLLVKVQDFVREEG